MTGQRILFSKFMTGILFAQIDTSAPLWFQDSNSCRVEELET